MAYTAIAGKIKTEFFDHVTLDGLAFAPGVFASDVDAAEWLQENVESHETVLEASGEPYTTYGRISSWTGIPTLVGWVQHEQLWRNTDPLVAERVEAIDRIYSSASTEEALDLLHTHQVDYVFVGSLERDKYGLLVFDRFSFLPIAFQAPGAVIYKVPPPTYPQSPCSDISSHDGCDEMEEAKHPTL